MQRKEEELCSGRPTAVQEEGKGRLDCGKAGLWEEWTQGFCERSLGGKVSKLILFGTVKVKIAESSYVQAW